ncbi:hypothetical protein [Polynucleobacter asymbioticus]|uniref:hypothetical protein n=1 Tax=Polynucleobacter asymbioticus TaxID=576611 RepID=UPI0008F93803|nr:hypothetical protein [Polynucleobacter asymbioticus]
MEIVEYPNTSSNPKNISFLIVGLVRDCGDQILKNIESIESAFKFAKKIRFLIIESDSSDNSVQILGEISSKKEYFNYVSLGNLREQYPKRANRIAHCRNYYLKLINENQEYSDVNYVVVADMDGVNNKLNEQAIRSCWDRQGWDVCCANQLGPYYDVWALRHSLWSPNDCWQQASFLESKGLSNYHAVLSSVYSRMVCIASNSDWIEVQSAFGGLAIYRKEILKLNQYIGLTSEGDEVCEHVSLHNQICSKGGRIFINPEMVNAGLVEHARYATSIGLKFFWIRSQLRQLVKITGLGPALKKMRTLKIISK